MLTKEKYFYNIIKLNDKINSKSKRTKTNLRYMMKAKHIFKANFF